MSKGLKLNIEHWMLRALHEDEMGGNNVRGTSSLNLKSVPPEVSDNWIVNVCTAACVIR